MDKQVVLKTWVIRGIRQLFLANFLDKYYFFSNEKTFNLLQGVELILKACILAINENRYFNISENESQEKIDKFIKNYSHGFQNIIEEIKYDKLTNYFNTFKIEGVLISKLISQIISESRYPVPENKSILEKFPFNGSKEWNIDIFYSLEFSGFFYELSYLALKYLEENHQFIIKDILTFVEPSEKDLQEKFESFWNRFYATKMNKEV